MPIAAVTDSARLSMVENANPENNMGNVTITVLTTLPVSERNKSALESSHKPRMREDTSPSMGSHGELNCIRWTTRLAINAMINMDDITIAVTYQVLPQLRLNSVIAFVSMSMKPAPKKKKAKY